MRTLPLCIPSKKLDPLHRRFKELGLLQQLAVHGVIQFLRRLHGEPASLSGVHLELPGLAPISETLVSLGPGILI